MDVVVLDDGNRGNFNQAAGIAERLPGARVAVVGVPARNPFGRCLLTATANLGRVPSPRFFRDVARQPGVCEVYARAPRDTRAVFAAGRRAAPYNLFLAWTLGALSVQVLYPEFLDRHLFDLLVLPGHDRRRYRLPDPLPANVMVITGAPNRIRPGLPPGVPPPFPDQAPGEPAPLDIAVLVGGQDRNYALPAAWAEELSRRLLEAAGDKPGMRVCLATSRRTPREAERIFRARLGGRPDRFQLALVGEGDVNPVSAFLAWAGLVLATEDSVNMVSEAAASGKPTLVLRVARKGVRRLVFDDALADMKSRGYLDIVSLAELTGGRLAAFARRPFRVLAETERVSRRVGEMLAARAAGPTADR